MCQASLKPDDEHDYDEDDDDGGSDIDEDKNTYDKGFLRNYFETKST